MRQHIKSISTLATLVFLTTTAHAQQTTANERVCDAPLVSVDPDGNVTRGSKAAAIQAVESGKAIRVGFGLGPGLGANGDFFLTHWFEAGWLTVMSGDVFTQTPIIHGQRPTSDPVVDMDFPDQAIRWVGTLGTNGQLHSKGLLDDKVADFKVYSWWCLAE